jgi:hypothetical protein
MSISGGSSSGLKEGAARAGREACGDVEEDAAVPLLVVGRAVNG